jgi:cytoskeletal protein RodZ
MDVGTVLRNARERKGLSLDQLAQATKIRVATLRAIEANEREKLPPVIFVRGFVSAYAREVGLNPDDTAWQYLDQFEEAPQEVEAVEPDMPEARSASGPNSPEIGPSSLDGQSIFSDDIDCDQIERFQRRRDLHMVLTMFGAVVAAYAVIAWWRAPGPPTTSSIDADAAVSASLESGSMAPVAPARAEPATADADGLTAVDATADDLVHLELRAHGLCWVSATVDGGRVMYRLMQPGERQTLEVRDAAVLRVGDAAALSLFIDSQEGRPLGLAGQPVTLHITPQNHQRFLESAPSL